MVCSLIVVFDIVKETCFGFIFLLIFSSDLDGLRKTKMRNAYSSDIPPDFCYLKLDVEKR